jgi:PAS domain S-box
MQDHRNSDDLRLIFDTVAVGLFHVAVGDGGTFRLTSVNRAFLELTGLAREEAEGASPADVLPGPFGARLAERVETAARDRRTVRWRDTIPRSGGEKPVAVTLRPVCDATGRCTGVAGSLTVPGDHPSPEGSAARLDHLYRTLSEVNQAIVRAEQPETLMTEICRILVEHGGFRMAWVGLKRTDGTVAPVGAAGFEAGYLESVTVRWDDTAEGRGPTGRAIREGRPVVLADCLDDPAFSPWRREALGRSYRSSGAFPIPVEDDVVGALSVYVAEAGGIGEEEAALLAGLARDLGYALHAMKTREALRASEERFRLAFHTSPDSINLNRLEDGVYVDVNDGFTRITGFSRDEVIGKSSLEIKIWNDPEDRRRLLRELKRHGVVRNLEAEFRMKDGRIRTGLMSAAVITLGGVPQILSITKDITERKEADRARRELEKRLRLHVEHTPLGVIEWDQEFRVTAWNRAAEEIFGFTAEDALGRHAAGLIVPQSARAQVDRVWRELLAGTGGRRSTNENITKDGRIIVCEWYNTPLIDEAGTVYGVASLVLDVTERRRAQAALHESEQRYRSFFENDISGCYIVTVDGRLVDCNPALVEMFGFESREAALGTRITGFYSDAGSRDAFLDQLRRDGEVKGREAVYQSRDGSEIHVLENAVGIFDDTGELELIQGYLVDITRVKSLERQLQQAQKIESIGRLAGGIAHDFNNILQAMTGHLELLERELGPRDACRRHLVELRAAADRAAQLTRQLLAFSRRQVLEPRNLDLNELVSGVLTMLHRLIGEDLQLDFEPAARRLTVWADPGQLQQVLLNLVVNARDATPPGGQIRIATREEAADEEFRQLRPWARAPRYAAVAVSDTGVGIPEDIRSRIFEPFFTTKETGKGTGLGLSTAYGIVSQHGGAIEVESEPGTGSTFTVFLPLAAGEVEEAPVPAPRDEAPGGGETILLAEDDPAVRGVVAETLRSAGYTVLEAADGPHAVRLFDEHPERVALALLDVVMPGMNGREVEARLRRRRPGLPVLFSSGYSENALHDRFVLDGNVELIRKPYSVKELLARIRDVLDRRG